MQVLDVIIHGQWQGVTWGRWWVIFGLKYLYYKCSIYIVQLHLFCDRYCCTSTLAFLLWLWYITLPFLLSIVVYILCRLVLILPQVYICNGRLLTAFLSQSFQEEKCLIQIFGWTKKSAAKEKKTLCIYMHVFQTTLTEYPLKRLVSFCWTKNTALKYRETPCKCAAI